VRLFAALGVALVALISMMLCSGHKRSPGHIKPHVTKPD
jgi:hypothetical protein